MNIEEIFCIFRTACFFYLAQRLMAHQFYLLLFFFDKIEVDTSNLSLFIRNVIPHVTTVFCNLTGFCNVFRSAWIAIKI